MSSESSEESHRSDSVLEVRLAPSPWGELWRRLEEHGEVAVVVVLGADDEDDGGRRPTERYAPKPPPAVQLSVRARRLPATEAVASTELHEGGLRLDWHRGLAWVGQRNVSVTIRELAVLAYLADSADRAVSKSELLKNVWGRGEDNPNLVEVYIAKLRRKLERLETVEIVTVRGLGYRLSTFDEA